MGENDQHHSRYHARSNRVGEGHSPSRWNENGRCSSRPTGDVASNREHRRTRSSTVDHRQDAVVDRAALEASFGYVD